MPYRKAPQSLEKMCLLVICKNFQTMQDELVQLPSTFINDVFEQIDLYSCCKHLPSTIFIRPETKSLQNLEMFDLPIESVLREIGRVCKRLVSLDLSSVCKIRFTSLRKVLQLLPRLARLDLENSTYCNDELVDEIAENCPQLTHLDLLDCANVKSVRSLSECTKLVELNTCRTRVTAKGCLYLLKRLPVLKVFKNDRWRRIFYLLKKQFELDRTVRICSNSIEDTAITFDEYEDIDIAIGSFPRLRNLSIAGSGSVDLNIMLEHAIMQRLINLHLDLFDDVDISLIDRSCPVLESLKLQDCRISISGAADSGEYIPFKKLRVLGLDGGINDMNELLKCVNVEELEITEVDAFRDSLVAELVNSNVLNNLKILSLSECEKITKKGIMDLVKMSNPLSELIIVDCVHINSSDLEVIDNYVERKNLDLKIIEETRWRLGGDWELGNAW